jgi:uncharacterized protein with von Willebrand factor type A (vWA) domain
VVAKKVPKTITKKVAKVAAPKPAPKKAVAKKVSPKKAPAKRSAKKAEPKKADETTISTVKLNVPEESKAPPSKNTMYVLLLDESGSMSGKPWEDLKSAAKDFSALVSAPAKISIITYHSNATVKGENLGSAEAFELLEKISYFGGGTSFGEALRAAK